MNEFEPSESLSALHKPTTNSLEAFMDEVLAEIDKESLGLGELGSYERGIEAGLQSAKVIILKAYVRALKKEGGVESE